MPVGGVRSPSIRHVCYPANPRDVCTPLDMLTRNGLYISPYPRNRCAGLLLRALTTTHLHWTGKRISQKLLRNVIRFMDIIFTATGTPRYKVVRENCEEVAPHTVVASSVAALFSHCGSSMPCFTRLRLSMVR
jgi:hypothetical protein